MATNGLSGAVWSVARGLARSVEAYKGHLAACDVTRRNDLDGRGTLSEEQASKWRRPPSLRSAACLVIGPVACLVIKPPVLYSSAVSRLRRSFLSDRFFFVTVRLLKRHSEMRNGDFRCLALACRRARVLHRFYLTAGHNWHLEKRRTADLKDGGPRYLLFALGFSGDVKLTPSVVRGSTQH